MRSGQKSGISSAVVVEAVRHVTYVYIVTYIYLSAPRCENSCFSHT